MEYIAEVELKVQMLERERLQRWASQVAQARSNMKSGLLQKLISIVF